MTNPDDLIPNKLYRINHPSSYSSIYKFINRSGNDLYFQIIQTNEIIKINKGYIGKILNKGDVGVFYPNTMAVPAYNLQYPNGKTWRIPANQMPRSRKTRRRTRRQGLNNQAS
jgi:hypothetical protein